MLHCLFKRYAHEHPSVGGTHFVWCKPKVHNFLAMSAQAKRAV